jgi:hypothetical protein
MALFVDVDNQTILWEILQQQPEIQTIPLTKRGEWFKDHVRSFYESLSDTWFQTSLTTKQLNQLNQTVLRIMLTDLREKGEKAFIPDPSPPRPTDPGDAYARRPATDLDRPHGDRRGMRGGTGNEYDDMHQQFLRKQEEMTSMLNVQAPANIDFKLSELDEPLTNIEELVQKQLQERKDLLQAPPPVVPVAPPLVVPAPVERPRLTIHAKDAQDPPPPLDIQPVSGQKYPEYHAPGDDEDPAPLPDILGTLRELQDRLDRLERVFTEHLQGLDQTGDGDELPPLPRGGSPLSQP